MTIDPIFLAGTMMGTLTAFVVHEYCHAYMAYQLGDPTAKYEGRLTANPIVHLHPVGSLVLVLSTVLSQGTCPVGWARPVNYNLDNLKRPFFDAALIALAGPFSNFVLGLLLCLLYHLALPNVFIAMTIAANFAFGMFNCFPLPGLDGWKMLQAVLPQSLAYKMRDFEMKVGLYGVAILIFASPILVSPILVPSFHWVMTTLLDGGWPPIR
jgi:Zn-dependent protease